MRILLAILALSLAAAAQTTPEHLYPTDDESVTLYRYQLQKQHIISEANEKLAAVNAQLQREGDKIITDHKLAGKFAFNANTLEFSLITEKPKAEDKKK